MIMSTLPTGEAGADLRRHPSLPGKDLGAGERRILSRRAWRVTTDALPIFREWASLRSFALLPRI
jgi:hypothetical protein